MASRSFNLAALTIISVFVFITLWEFLLEETVLSVLGFPGSEEDNVQHWRYVATVTIFTAMAIIVPVFLLAKLDAQSLKVRKSLLESESKYRTLVETSHDFIWSVDTEGRFTFVNEASNQTHGYEPAEMIGRPFTDFMTKEQAEIDLAVFAEIKDGNDFIDIETVHLKKDGTPINLSFNAIVMRDSEGNVIGTTGTAKDITGRRQSEIFLRQSEERFSKVFQSSPALVSISTKDQAIIMDVNKVWLDTFGYQRDEAIGHTPFELNIFVDNDIRNRAVRQIDQDRHVGVETQYQTKSGEVREFLVSGEPIEFQGQDCYLFISQDITELKRAEKETRLQRDQLAHVSRVSTMGEMATSLAHELTQPLAAMAAYIDGSLRRIEVGETFSEEIKDALSKASDQARRSGKIIRTLRDFVANAEIHTEAVSINDEVKAIVELADADLRQASIQVHLELAEPFPPLNAEPILLQQVILNLIRNSIDAMEGIDSQKRELRIESSHENEHLILTVSDTGSGINSQEHAQIFDPYFSKKLNGLGLGLPICRSIVERYGGLIWSDPNNKLGAKFIIQLPRLQETEISS